MSGIIGTILGVFLAVTVVHDLVSLRAVHPLCAFVHSAVGPHQWQPQSCEAVERLRVRPQLAQRAHMDAILTVTIQRTSGRANGSVALELGPQCVLRWLTYGLGSILGVAAFAL